MAYKKGNAVKLSANFKSTEFDCRGKGCCSTTLIDEKLVRYLQKIRNHFKLPIIVNSAYRCEKHNAIVGGASKSKHRYGKAADIAIKGVLPMEIAKYAESIGILGIGLYEGKDGNFVHIDTRDVKSFWYGKNQKKRTTFGGGVIKINTKINTVKEVQNWANINYKSGLLVDGIYGAKTQTALVKILQSELNQTYNIKLVVDGIFGCKTKVACPVLKNGDKNNVVRVVQALLICNKIPNIYVDGIFGSATTTAVKAYQKKKKLVVSGVVDKNTFAELCN